ncbi:MAG TPA: hypothetical protein VF493_09160 [Terriglobales bacterium]
MNTALRPMSTSQVLDRTFHLYRNNFLLFCGIAALPAALLLIMRLAIVIFTQITPGKFGGEPYAGIYVGLTFLLGIFLVVVGYALAGGASVYAVSLVHLERPATIRESYQKVRAILGRLLNVVISVFLRSMGILMLAMLVFVALAVGFAASVTRPSAEVAIVGVIIGIVLLLVGAVVALFLYARYSLAVPACIIEEIPARQALRRSTVLTKGSIGRIILIYILVGIISAALPYLLLAPVFIWIAMHAAAGASQTQLNKLTTPMMFWNLIGEFLARTLAAPIATIAIALVYYDERIRKEAFDLQYMMQAIDGAQVQAATTSSAG